MSRLERLVEAVGDASEDGVAAVREALEGLKVDRVYFVIRVAISGPYSLEGLFRDRVDLIGTRRAGTQRALAVDVTDTIGRPPFTMRWWVLAGHDIPALESYLVVRGTVLKLGHKPSGLKRGAEWDGRKEVRAEEGFGS